MCSGEVAGDGGLGRGQMAKGASQLLQQFKDKATSTGIGEIMPVASPKGSKFPPLIQLVCLCGESARPVNGEGDAATQNWYLEMSG